ncbi:hypothetical protein, partial [Stenotrophomonas maltophilia]|uniref:hypothetical protein n=1 Tax=Stenotrophomonas maltophilia TaxID=40324 RepID=UPI0013DD40AE
LCLGEHLVSGAVTELLPIPGCETPLVFERTEDGRLLRLSAGERVYVDATQDGRTQYDGLANVDTIFLPAGFVRHVETRGERW